MKKELKVPTVGESITEVTIGKILKKQGSYVKTDEEIIEIETDKLNQVLYASDSGVLSLRVQTGDVVKVGDVIGEIEVTTEKIQETKATPTPKEPLKTEKARVAKEDWIGSLDEPKTVLKEETSKENRVSPSSRGETRKKMTKIRKVISERLLDVTQQTAMLTTFNEIDMSQVIALREKYKDEFSKKYGVKLGFMSFFVKAVTCALQAIPEVNSYIDGDDFVTRNYIDIGIAVSTERGLIVPVLRDTNLLSYAQIEKNIDDYAARAKTGRLTVDELTGGSFTITNGGTLGSLLSTPIINPPQCAILGMHKIGKRAVVVDDQIVIRPMMYVALSYDHRVLDGKEAISFLVSIKTHLEDLQKEILGL